MNWTGPADGVVRDWLDCCCSWRDALPAASALARSIAEEAALAADAAVGPV